jgi:tetratricopeptide (TPR) repeat protein
MKRFWAAAALVGALLPWPAGAREKKTEEPFYRRYLIPGNALDDRIREQERRVQADPSSATLRNDFGNLLAARRFPKEAREQYEIAMKLDKSNFIAPYNLGMVYETEGKISEAISAYEKSVDRNRGFPPARFRLGRLYERRGRANQAVAQYARALEIDPGMRDVRRNPLVADTRLLDRVSLFNYEKDIARASLATGALYADEAIIRRVPTDRPLFSSDLVDPAEPETVDARRPSAARVPASLPAGPGETRPQQDLEGRPAPPPVPQAPASQPTPQENPYDPLGLGGPRPRPPQATPVPQ